jgi:hypothetical protein
LARILQGVSNVFTRTVQGFQLFFIRFLQGCCKAYLQGVLNSCHTAFTFFYIRLLQATESLLQGFYEVFTQLSRGVYNAFKGFLQGSFASIAWFHLRPRIGWAVLG